MLRVLHVENWKSFRDPIDFTMIAGRESRHGETLFRDGKSRVLPTAAIYGANAAGKSALLEAVQQLRDLVCEPRAIKQRLPYNPHRLYGDGKPTVLGVEIVLDLPDPTSRKRNAIVYYEVSYTAERIVTESLYRLRSEDEEALFIRQEQNVALYGDLEDNEFIKASARTIQENRLLLEMLANSERAEVEDLVASVVEWFRQVVVIRRGASFVKMPEGIAKNESFRHLMSAGLSEADTGISEVLFVSVPRGKVPLPDDLLSQFEGELASPGDEGFLANHGSGLAFHLRREESGEISYEQLATTHEDRNGSFTLPLDEESDGTIRFLNLIPILYWAVEQESCGVFFIDELEDSLHPGLTEDLLRRFLAATGEDQRRQLIFTTHELHLIRADLLRRDEIWLVEKRGHNSGLIRVTDFSGSGVRKGTDLVNAYMSGRLGGVPRI
ncbi:AAA family ATPase [uncultured Actinomyces sp.]|jgi:putative abortive phage resistance protein|uniref:AAA family ATPase n=1 Tax=uncultured Actinomyces sp. TaxID=249061 RepID=UPI0028D52336|nr:AAA family ATPase [uncultured Actinomyces sp.]